MSACSGKPEELVTRFSGATMGTSYHITVVTTEALQNPEGLKSEIDQSLLVLNQQMSTYISDSELNRLKLQPVGQWEVISEPLAEVLSISQQVSEVSGGAFDITLRPLIDLWGFGPENTQDQVPSDSDILAARSQVGYQWLELDRQGLRLRRLKDVDIDLSAVAKGYGVDRVADLLERNGIDRYLVEIGGEMRLKGRNPGNQLWRIAIERPDPSLMQSVYKTLSLSDIGVATSGDYRNFFEQGGVRYSHTIDPRTGRPITNRLASVTVLNPSAAMADALATAFSVLGEKDALRLANSEGVAALFIIERDGIFVEQPSDAFRALLPTSESERNDSD
ncbi:FAD:protein FMN transferase [Pseudomaricurvus hydrocarbonicus]|uniref:FAD:protein FMN transferase n=1 Tax=Pseudomaricurvus hydrocarbonicus TaxID=1470433 RepID=UPI001AA04D2A|nr:FAD:protein FMN transferase [Aestuariicella hydrocarbonica]